VVSDSNWGSDGGVRNMGGFNWFAGGLGEWVLDVGASNLGDGVAVLNLDGDNLDLGVVNAVLGGHFTASVLDGGGDGVSNGVGSDRGNGDWSSGDVVGGIGSGEELRIGLSVGLTLGDAVVSNNGGLVADDVGDLLADLLVFNLLGVDGLLGADVFGRGDAGLCHEDFGVSLAVGSGNCDGSSIGSMGVRSSSNELGVGLSIGLRGGASEGNETRNGENLHVDEIERYFPRWLVELK